MTQQTVSDWERDRGRPHVTRAGALDAALQLPAGTMGRVLQVGEWRPDLVLDSGDGMLAIEIDRRPAARSGIDIPEDLTEEEAETIRVVIEGIKARRARR